LEDLVSSGQFDIAISIKGKGWFETFWRDNLEHTYGFHFFFGE
jgi:hypothetical protein